MQTVLLRDLGLDFGHPQHRITTTFNDGGGAPADSPFRRAVAHIEPTTLGALAAAASLMEYPHIVAGLLVASKRPGWTLFDHIVGGIYNVVVAATYGDSATLNALRQHMKVTHSRTIREDEQPPWFEEFVTPSTCGSFKTGDLPLMYAVTITLGATIARAHLACGLVTEEAFPDYGRDFMATVGHISGFAVPMIPLTYQDLQDAEARLDIPAMDFGQVQRTVVPDLVTDLLKNKIGNQTLGEFAELFVGFMNRDARKALGLPWKATDQERLRLYCADYQAITAQPGHPARTEDNFFIASRRGVVQN